MTTPSVRLALAAVLVLAGCVQDAPPETTTPTTTPTATTPTGEPMAAEVEVGELQPTVAQSLYYLRPAKLELHAGMPVNLTLVNAGRAPHDLVIDGLDVKIDSIEGGQSASVEFTPLEPGTYEMYCTLGSPPLDHRGNGMRGEVVVS